MKVLKMLWKIVKGYMLANTVFIAGGLWGHEVEQSSHDEDPCKFSNRMAEEKILPGWGYLFQLGRDFFKVIGESIGDWLEETF